MAIINEMEYRAGITELEDRFKEKYTQSELQRIGNNIKNSMHPTIDEWNKTIGNLKANQTRLPKTSVIRQSLEWVRKQSEPEPLINIECNMCNPHGSGLTPGWVFIMQDGNRIAIACGCGNTPAWAINESTEPNTKKRKTWTRRQLIDKEYASATNFIDIRENKLIPF